jgi:hypothetical protein
MIPQLPLFAPLILTYYCHYYHLCYCLITTTGLNPARSSAASIMQEIVDQIVQSLTDDKFRGKLVVILAGYAADIDQLMSANAGLASRFGNTITFPDFTSADCCQLLQQALASQQLGSLALTPAAAAALPEMTARLAAAPRFGNGRTVKDWAKGVFSAVGERKFGAVTNSCNNSTSSSSTGSSSRSSSVDEGVGDVTVGDLEAALQVLLSNMAVRSDAPQQLQLQQLQMAPLQQAPLPCATATASATAVQTAAAPPAQQQQQVVVEDDWEEVELLDTELDSGSSSNSSSLSSEELAALVAAGTTAGVSPDSPLAALLSNAAFTAAVAAEQRISTAAAAETIAKLEQERAALAAAAAAAAEAETARVQELEQRAAELAAQRQLAALQALRDAEALRQREQLAVQHALQSMGVCSAGFQWIKRSSGWQCAGGSHFISDSEVSAATKK